MERLYQIFGMIIKLNTVKSNEGAALHDELSIYPILNNINYDLEINYLPRVKTDDIISNNPSINYLSNKSIVFKLGVTTVKFYIEEGNVKKIDFSIDQKSGIKSNIEKWKSLQFTTNEENIGQFFHELVLVPFAFLSDYYSVVHCSGIANSKDEVVLFGGTGGVGKTSLEMELCLKHNCSFYNDDISVIDAKGNCYPNFSYPKIYGYNLIGEGVLRNKILKSLSFSNNFHYKLRSIKGGNKVRRRVNPQEFYGNILLKSKKPSSIIILFRNNVERISLEKVNSKKIAEYNSLIIGSEYNVFFNHLRWYEFNALSINKTPFTTYKSIIEKNTKNLESGIAGLKKIYLAHIPLNISNADFKIQMVDILKKNEII